jgi:acyl phosphate:glycerol-3-phosphate acyltransferase
MNVWLLGGLGYVIGSIPFAYLVTRARGGPDIRTVGSGNVGATNVQRVRGTKAALLTALLDVLKGAVPPLLASASGAGVVASGVAGVAAVTGHLFPVWLGFRGGKGVSTTLGACLAWAPPVAAVAIAVFVVTVWLSRLVSLGSILSATTLGPLGYAWAAPRSIVIALFVAGWLIVVQHRGNLMRLVTGQERRLSR